MRLQRPLSSLIVIAAVAVAALALASPSSAASPRNPQVSFCTASLQNYLNGIGENINVATDQVDAQVWRTTISGNATFTVMLEQAGNAPLNSIGVYNGDVANPVLFLVFPGAATQGWFATLSFSGGNLMVTLFDNNSIIQGQTYYTGVISSKFGFYLQGPGGLFFSQDYRNPGGNAQILTYAGTGGNSGTWWQCFEDMPYAYPDCVTDFEDVVLSVESVNPTPALGRTWGGLKALYR